MHNRHADVGQINALKWSLEDPEPGLAEATGIAAWRYYTASMLVDFTVFRPSNHWLAYLMYCDSASALINYHSTRSDGNWAI